MHNAVILSMRVPIFDASFPWSWSDKKAGLRLKCVHEVHIRKIAVILVHNSIQCVTPDKVRGWVVQEDLPTTALICGSCGQCIFFNKTKPVRIA